MYIYIHIETILLIYMCGYVCGGFVFGSVCNVTVTISLFRGYIILESQGESLTIVPCHPSSIYYP